MLFSIKHLLHVLAMPPMCLLLVAALGLYLRIRRPRLGNSLLIVSAALLVVLSMPIVGASLAHLEQTEAALDLRHPPAVDAVAVLGGGSNGHAPEYGGSAAPTALTLARLVYAAHVARELRLPILVTGAADEAAAMANALRRDLHTEPRWVDDSATDTYDNARHAAALLRAAGLGRVIVVTGADHAPRATAEFRAAGLTAYAGPTQFAPRVADVLAGPQFGLLPTTEGLTYSEAALRELLGRLVRPAMSAVHRRLDPQPPAR